jgi:hypothetical protein
MKRIPLSQGLSAIVDNKDYFDLCFHKWYAHNRNGLFYATRKESANSPHIDMAYEVMEKKGIVVTNGKMIDHKNRDTLDNRKSNLRVVTRRENTCNSRGQVGKTSKYKGVSWYPGTKKWSVQSAMSGRQKTIGYFDNEVEAAEAYDRYAVLYGGKYAYLNFPEKYKEYIDNQMLLF